MDANEKEAVLSLSPYFSKDRIVFDVGSNKGEWADILVSNCQMHLFEPNIPLLHYTAIKYAHLDNVDYCDALMSHEQGTEIWFYQFMKKYHGLSSAYNNPAWNHLPAQKIKKVTGTVDNYCEAFRVETLDFLKIDVEGAEWDVIQGAERLLSEKKIKFIQFEYSEHYKVPGYKGQQIIDFVKPFGYELYEYQGSWRKAHFKEDYQRKNYYLMQEFTENWNDEFIKSTTGMKFDIVLEVGAFEGLTTNYICDFLLNEGGRVVVIDPLKDEYLTENLDDNAKTMNKELSGFKGQYDRFIRNTRDKPVELHRMASNKAFKLKAFKFIKFDLIYIDGDHRPKQVYRDAVNAFNCLAERGYILFDDYEWNDTKEGIDRFVNVYKKQIKVISVGYQVLIQRHIL